MIEVIHRFTCEVCSKKEENVIPCPSMAYQLPSFLWAPKGWRELYGHVICPDHCVAVVKVLGGGGHAQAAGFTEDL